MASREGVEAPTPRSEVPSRTLKTKKIARFPWHIPAKSGKIRDPGATSLNRKGRINRDALKALRFYTATSPLRRTAQTTAEEEN
jgi:hypothetical protein